MIRKHIEFKGRVQGVGFRYRAKHAADMYGATGWVINNPDGTVTMELQGTKEQIDNVISTIENGFYIRVDAKDVTDVSVIEVEKTFHNKG